MTDDTSPHSDKEHFDHAFDSIDKMVSIRSWRNKWLVRIAAVFAACIIVELGIFEVTNIDSQRSAHNQNLATQQYIIHILKGHSKTIGIEDDTLNQIKSLAKQIESLTSPAAEKKNAAEIKAVIKQVVLCIENHEDRDAAVGRGEKPGPVLAGCPTQIPAAGAPHATPKHHKAKKK